MGQVVRLLLSHGGTIERTLDALGREVLRTLPRGGHMISRHDGVGAMVERRIAGPYATTTSAAWVGLLPEGTTFTESFVCSPAGDMIDRVTSDGERERFAYDPAGRIAAHTSSTGARELYGYDRTGHIVAPAGRFSAHSTASEPGRRSLISRHPAGSLRRSFRSSARARGCSRSALLGEAAISG